MHGLYASAGTWVPVLKYFNKYRVTLVTIDYHTAILDNKISDLILEISSNLPKNFHTAIGHSFGSLFLNLLGLRSQNNIYIAPPFLASMFSREKYLEVISSTTKYHSYDIFLVVKQAIKMTADSDLNFVPDDKFLLPLADEFFAYADNICPVQYFPGSHSEVESAIEYLFSKSLVSC